MLSASARPCVTTVRLEELQHALLAASQPAAQAQQQAQAPMDLTEDLLSSPCARSPAQQAAIQQGE